MKKFVCLLLATMMLLSLVACAPTKEAKKPVTEASETKTPATEAPVAETSEEGLTGAITFAHHRSDLELEIEDLVAGFCEENPGVEVNIEVIADYNNAMAIRLAGDEVPDVFMLHENIAPASTWPDYCLPLDSSEVSPKDRFRESWSIDGHPYALTSVTGVNGFFYNKTLWKEAGIEETPTTWAEFEECMEKLSKLEGVIPLTTQYKTGWAVRYWAELYGSAFKGGNLKNLWPETEEPFSDPIVSEIMVNFRNLVNKGYCEKDLMSSDWDMQAPDFVAGKIGTYLAGNYIVPTMVGLGMDADDIGAFPFPNLDNSSTQPGKVLLDRDMGICVSKKTTNAKTAVALADYLALNYGEFTNQLSGIAGAECHVSSTNEILGSGAEIVMFENNSAEYVEINALAGLNIGGFVQEYLITDDTQVVVDAYNVIWRDALNEYGK